MIPQEYIAWLQELPESVLATRPVQNGRFAIKYVAPLLDTNHDAALLEIVRKDLTRNMGKMQHDVYQDMRESVDLIFASNDQMGSWREVPLFDAMQKVVFKSTNRVFVGSPLCHDEGYLRWSAAFAQFLGAGCVIVGQYMPSILKPVVGYMGAVPVYVAQRKAFSYLIPLFKERIQNMCQKRDDPSYPWTEPKSLITWMVAVGLNRKDPEATRPEILAERLLFLVSNSVFPC